MRADVLEAASFILSHRRLVKRQPADNWSPESGQREIRRCWPEVTIREAYRAATRLAAQ